MKKSLMLAGCFLGASLFCDLNASEQKPLESQGLKISNSSVQSFVSSVEHLMRSEDQQEVDDEEVLATATALLANRLSKLGGLKSDLAVRLAGSIILGNERKGYDLKYVADKVRQALETRAEETESETKTLPDLANNMDYVSFPLEGYLMHIFSEVIQDDLRTLSIIHNQNAEFFSNVFYGNSEEEEGELPVSSEDVSSLLGPNVMNSLANAHENAEFVKNNEELVQKVNALYNAHAPKQNADWKNEEDMIEKIDGALTDIGNALGAAKRTIGNDVDMIRDIFKDNPLSCVSLATKHQNGLAWLDHVASMVTGEGTKTMPALFSLRYGAMDALFKNGDLKGALGAVLSAEASALTAFVKELYFPENEEKDETPEEEDTKQAEDYLAAYEKAHQNQDPEGDLTKSLFNYYKQEVYLPAAAIDNQEAVNNAARVSLLLANELLLKVFPLGEQNQPRSTTIEGSIGYLKTAQIFAALGFYMHGIEAQPTSPDIILDVIEEEEAEETDVENPELNNEEETKNEIEDPNENKEEANSE